MTNQNSDRKNVKPIRKSRLSLRLAVEQLCVVIQGGELSNGSRLISELELARAPNICQNTLRAALSCLENEGIIFRRRGVGTFVVDRLNRHNNININWGITQVIKATGAIPSISEIYIEHVRSFLEIHQSIYHYFEQELNLAIGHATSWLQPMAADTNMV